MTTETTLPEGFEQLEPFVETWPMSHWPWRCRATTSQATPETRVISLLPAPVRTLMPDSFLP